MTAFKPTLDDDIEGKFVVINASAFRNRSLPVALRVVQALRGFGCTAGLSGTAVYCRFAVDGEESRWERFQLERMATEAEVKLCADIVEQAVDLKSQVMEARQESRLASQNLRDVSKLYNDFVAELAKEGEKRNGK